MCLILLSSLCWRFNIPVAYGHCLQVVFYGFERGDLFLVRISTFMSLIGGKSS